MKQEYPWYRADIEGLRALAVLAVVFFHFGFGFVRGGFLGVDVFFVISGYLITLIIVREHRAGTFSFAAFWARRMRRILPALTVLMLCTSLYMYAHVPKFESFTRYGESVLSQSFFVSNLYFLQSFNPLALPVGFEIPEEWRRAAEEHAYILRLDDLRDQGPLTHTWTLSVEEQFYIFFPLLLVGLLFFLRKNVRWILFLLAGLSYALYAYLLVAAPYQPFALSGPFFFFNADAGFYLLPARAWELLAGALAALMAFKMTARASEAISALGLVMILIGFAASEIRPASFGVLALLPVLGTTLVILGGRGAETFTKKILSWPPFVWVGLISYSLYLWHWPVYLFAKQLLPPESFTLAGSAALILLTIGIAKISYELVEKPFLKKHDWPLKQVYIYGFASMLLMGALGFLMMLAQP